MMDNVPERVGLDEGVLVSDDVRGVERGENAYLVEGVFLLLIRQVIHLYLLQCVDLRVYDPLHLVNARVSALA